MALVPLAPLLLALAPPLQPEPLAWPLEMRNTDQRTDCQIEVGRCQDVTHFYPHINTEHDCSRFSDSQSRWRCRHCSSGCCRVTYSGVRSCESRPQGPPDYDLTNPNQVYIFLDIDGVLNTLQRGRPIGKSLAPAGQCGHHLEGRLIENLEGIVASLQIDRPYAHPRAPAHTNIVLSSSWRLPSFRRASEHHDAPCIDKVACPARDSFGDLPTRPPLGAEV